MLAIAWIIVIGITAKHRRAVIGAVVVLAVGITVHRRAVIGAAVVLAVLRTVLRRAVIGAAVVLAIAWIIVIGITA